MAKTVTNTNISKYAKFKTYNDFKTFIQQIVVGCLMCAFFSVQAQSEQKIQTDKYSSPQVYRDLASDPIFTNIQIGVLKNSYFHSYNQPSDSSKYLKLDQGNFYCRSTFIQPFPSNDPDQKDKDSAYSNVFWFMSSSNNNLFQDQYEKETSLNYDKHTPNANDIQKCEFTIKANTISPELECQNKCQGKGFFLDNTIDPFVQGDKLDVAQRSLCGEDRTKSHCIQNQEMMETRELNMQYLSCGSKFLSKQNEGNTQAKVTVSKVGEANGHVFMLTNDSDYLEDFQQDWEQVTVTVEIPGDKKVPGPYNEVGCAVSKQKGFGILARGVRTLRQPWPGFGGFKAAE